ncbi:unnamed protein product [Tilletia laevis]|uniref:Heparan-alpha-glucosaminide N-acetyltransferase catalytic domain-containing protein n=2 Tax=Tilletia TaxID=13289 RepID=A0A8X7SZI7_9BASI|nr:hypothetical protein CF336_g3106 [Tilletia laevis]KAE8197304.1 hypothetical protein CF328_g3889 [Tilletia controversa]KAE8261144.1 hypothetical protein A4X03_0g3502 [Tilletia caries]KAE8202608.1 hypothetical protein CF335_g3350 [Tilletia laevis]KAE8253167.1 hypothetical protein A4X06_0g1651 [Tilletia controversa]
MSNGQTNPRNPAVTERTALLPPRPNAENGQPRSEVVRDASAKPTRQVAPDALRGLLMALMAFDHANVNYSVYPHGTSIHNESASEVVTEFSTGTGFVLRLLSHLCASGFALLLGFGLTFFVTSRAQRGWKARAQIGYLAKRAFAILVVNEATFLPFIAQAPVWMVNIVLPALAIDYLLIGLVLVALDYYVQPALERLRISGKKQTPASSSVGDEPEERYSEPTPVSKYGSVISWSLDAFLATLFFAAAFSTIWTAPNQGRCPHSTNSDTVHSLIAPWLDKKCKSSPSLIVQFFFLAEMCPNFGVISVFPPMAWISFVLLGVLYARVILRLKTSQKGLIAFNAALGLVFALLFVSTRLLRYGNLSTDCLQTAAQLHQRAGQNPYLADLKSFLYVTKYNPDPAFVFLTSSVNFFLLAFFGALFSLPAILPLRILQNFLLTLGVQALFFYAFHQLLLMFSAEAARKLVPGLFGPTDPAKFPREDGVGWGVFFGVWAGTMVVSYYACRGFAHFKARRGPDSIWRFV